MVQAGGPTGPRPAKQNPIICLLIYPMFFLNLMALEKFTQDPDFKWWMVLIPCYGFYYALTAVPAQVEKAKQMAGVSTPRQSTIMYLIVPSYALAVDINDIAQ